jgi:hypothetical protein
MPEPISFLTYALINTTINLVARPVGNWLGNKVDGDTKRKEALELKDYQHQLDLDTLRATKEYDAKAREELQRENFEQRVKEAQEQYRMQLQKWQDQSFDQRVWPLKTPYENITLKPIQIPGYNGIKIVPCRIFTAKSNKNQEYSRYLENTVNVNLSMFLETGYNFGGNHSVISHIGDWRNDEFQEDAFINALWYGIQGQPAIVLNPVITDNGNTLNLRISFWGLGTNQGQLTPDTTTVMKFDICNKKGTLIREESNQLMQIGLINISQELRFNFDLLESEKNAPSDKREKLIEKNIPRYRLASEVANTVNNKLSNYIGEAMCCFTGLYADVYHLIEYGTAPLMPQKMLSYSPNYKISPQFTKFYQGVLMRLAVSGYHGKNIKKIYVNTAEALSLHPDTAYISKDLVREALCIYIAENAASQDEITLPDNIYKCLDLIGRHNIKKNDEDFFNNVIRILNHINYKSEAESLNRILSANLQQTEQIATNSNLLFDNELEEYQISAYIDKPSTVGKCNESDDIFKY